MEKEKYLALQLLILKTARQISEMNIEGFLDQISTAEAVAPMIDPTMYRKAQDNLESIKNLAKSLLPVKKAYQHTFETVLNTAMRGDMEKNAGT